MKYSVLLVVLGLHLNGQGPVQWRLTSDVGVLRLRDSTSENLIYFNPGLVLRYSERFGRHQLQLQARLRPEFYEGQSRRTLLNLGGSVDYSARIESLSFTAGASEQRQNFYSHEATFFINRIQANVTADWLKNPVWIPRLAMQVNVQNVSGEVRSDYSGKSVSTLINFVPTSTFQWSNGLYAERFVIDVPRSNVSLTKNKGVGWGLLTGLVYDDYLTLRIDYRRIMRKSENLDDQSTEQQYSLVAGRPITPSIAAFFFLDLTQRNSNTGPGVPISLRINSGNYENRWYTKLAYEYSSATEIFIKAGYVTYDWYRRSPLSGFQMSVGLRSQN